MPRRSRIGSKRQTPSGRWQVRVQCGHREDGSPRVITDTVDTEAEADRRIAELSAELSARPDLARGVTLAALWERYATTKGARLAKKTLRGYDWYMRQSWLGAWGDRDITTITRADVQRAMLSMPRDKADRSRRVLSSVLTFAVNENLLDRNPIREGGFELPGDTGSTWEDEGAWDVDPFAAIEGVRDVWSAQTVMRAAPLMCGLPLEPAWLAIVGAGLRVEEALALRKMDVRRIRIEGREVTQLAVHHARTDLEERKRSKTRGSVRIVAVVEPFGTRLWELVDALPHADSLVCPVSASNQNHRWREYFMEPPTSKHCPKTGVYRGRLHGLPYLPLSRMRATHVTLMQEAGVLDSVNAAAHGHSELVAYTNYKRPDTTGAAEQTGRYLRLLA